jgi:hypothetical protein
MRLASFNVENLFNRAKAMNLGDWAEGKPVLNKFAKLNALLGEHVYTAAMKQRMVVLLIGLGLENRIPVRSSCCARTGAICSGGPKRVAWKSWPMVGQTGSARWS